MKREIKFRAKIKAKKFRVTGKPKNEGEWTYGEVHLQSTIPHIHEGMDKYPIDVDTVGQFTGMKDKNGKEIYEGDIYISDKGGINEVSWVIGDGCNFSGFDFAPFHHIEGVISDIEVLGNIHDNPELLKGGVNKSEFDPNRSFEEKREILRKTQIDEEMSYKERLRLQKLRHGL